jgi:predicted P-loop ATPase
MEDIHDEAKKSKLANIKAEREKRKPNGNGHVPVAEDVLIDLISQKVKRRVADMSKDDNKSAVIIACIKDLGVTLKYNVFSDQFFVNGLDKTDTPAKWDGQLADAAILEIRMRLDEIKPGFCPSTGRLREIVNTEAFRNSYHPVRDYLKSLKWDGIKRIETLFSQYFGAEDNEFCRAVSKLLLLAGVARVIDPGCKFDYVITLIGDQGLGKSTGIAALCPQPKWFTDQFPALSMSAHPGRDCQEYFRGRWIVEWGEMAGMHKSEAEQVKSLLSRQTDRGRPAYAQYPIDVDRQCVVIASTNTEECLHDTTGNRRFLPLMCLQTVLAGELQRDRDQLWAEAYGAFLDGQRPILDPKLYAVAAEEQDKCIDGGPYKEMLACLANYSEGIVTLDAAKTFIKVRGAFWDDAANKSTRLLTLAMASYGFRKSRYGPRTAGALPHMKQIFFKGDNTLRTHNDFQIITLTEV